LLGVSIDRKAYKDFPLVHWLLAGDATANSVPFNAYYFLANQEVLREWEDIFGAAEKWLGMANLNTDQLFEAGYHTSCHMCVDDPDTCIGDVEPPEKQEAEREKLYTKWGIEHPSIAALFDAIY
jgi:hypothetical protein